MNESFCDLIFKNSPIGYTYNKIVFNDDGKPIDYEIIEANCSFERLTGLRREEIIGMRAMDVIPGIKESEFDWIAYYGEVVINNEQKEFNQYSEITDLWYKVYCYSPLKNYFVTVLAEISEKTFNTEYNISQTVLSKTYQIARLKRIEEELKESQKKLAESNQLLQTVLDTIPLPIFWKDLNSVHLGGNKHYILESGKQSLSELVGKSDYELPWREYADKYRKDDLEIMTTLIPKINLEEYHVAADGTLEWVRVTKVPMMDEYGKVFGIMGAYEDITERKLAEQALHYEKERLKITLHSIGDGVIATDDKGRVQLINGVAEKLTGWTQAEAKDKYITDVFRIVNEDTRIPCENPVEKVM
ncbi:MAG: PAS domain S-box protein, partial [Clostridia bacterium]|nr:PAS domain S-box protein [Clostridia bacterium]